MTILIEGAIYKQTLNTATLKIAVEIHEFFQEVNCLKIVWSFQTGRYRSFLNGGKVSE